MEESVWKGDWSDGMPLSPHVVACGHSRGSWSSVRAELWRKSSSESFGGNSQARRRSPNEWVRRVLTLSRRSSPFPGRDSVGAPNPMARMAREIVWKGKVTRTPRGGDTTSVIVVWTMQYTFASTRCHRRRESRSIHRSHCYRAWTPRSHVSHAVDLHQRGSGWRNQLKKTEGGEWWDVEGGGGRIVASLHTLPAKVSFARLLPLLLLCITASVIIWSMLEVLPMKCRQKVAFVGNTYLKSDEKVLASAAAAAACLLSRWSSMYVRQLNLHWMEAASVRPFERMLARQTRCLDDL